MNIQIIIKCLPILGGKTGAQAVGDVQRSAPVLELATARGASASHLPNREGKFEEKRSVSI